MFLFYKRGSMDDGQFRQLLDAFHCSWSGYRKVRKGVKKRIWRHMQELGCRNISAYLDLLNKDPQLRRECEKRMTVSISRFFRDRQLWQGLEEDILPHMIEDEKKTLRIWSAGCARGEEVYSFKIIWDRLQPRCDERPQLHITATDLHPDYIAKARAGSYSQSSLREVSREIRAHYFDLRKSGRRFEVKPFLKEDIEWKVQDLFVQPPGAVFDIIFLRNNLLTYYQDELKQKGFSLVVKALAADGWLIVGAHEKPPVGAFNLVPHASIPWAYRHAKGRNS